MATKATDEKALAPIEPGGAVSTEVIDWDAFDLPDDGTGDIKPRWPEVKIVQSTSKMPDAKKHGGEFYHSDTEEFTFALDGVFLRTQQTRALFGDGDAPLCASADGRVPLPQQPLWEMASYRTLNGSEIPVPPGEGQPNLCAECPFSQFGENSEAPECSRSYITLIDRNSDPDDMDLAQIRISRTALKPFELMAGAIKAMRAGKGRVGLPLFAFNVHLYTEETTKGPKTWSQLRIDKERMPDTKLLAYAQAVKRFAGEFQETVRATVMASDDTREAAAGPAPAWGDGTTSYAPRDVTPTGDDGWDDGSG